MGRTRRKEKQSTRTVRSKTLRAKGEKKKKSENKERRETREDFSRKRQVQAFRGVSALEK
jgi:hypothetical protein